MTNMTAGVYKILANMRDTTERTIAVNELLKTMIESWPIILKLIQSLQAEVFIGKNP